MITFACFIIVPQHTASIDNKSQSIFETMLAP